MSEKVKGEGKRERKPTSVCGRVSLTGMESCCFQLFPEEGGGGGWEPLTTAREMDAGWCGEDLAWDTLELDEEGCPFDEEAEEGGDGTYDMISRRWSQRVCVGDDGGRGEGWMEERMVGRG